MAIMEVAWWLFGKNVWLDVSGVVESWNCGGLMKCIA